VVVGSVVLGASAAPFVATSRLLLLELRIRRMHVAAFLAVVIAVSALPLAWAVEGDSSQHPLLEQARRNVDQVAAQLADAGQDKDAAARALALVDTELAGVEAQVNEATSAVGRQAIEAAEAESRLAELRLEAARLEAGMSARAVDLYMHGSGAELEAVLGADDVQDAFDRSSLLDVITDADRTALETVVTARLALAAESERFDAEMDRLVSMQSAQQALLDSVEALRASRAEALRVAGAEVDDLERLEEDLAGDFGRIEKLIKDAKSTPVAASPPSSAGYGWPLCRSVTSRFGYRWGRQHKGIDIDGDTGNPIGASKAGVVIAAGYEGGYGNLVLIDHGDGIVTAYAHQSEIIAYVGQRVARGERIGSVGNSGNSTGSHLHFETRVNGTAVDPLQYLPNSC
jgi:murein DD-endopeptidase MepM/ murein hydrolase activator NlpD